MSIADQIRPASDAALAHMNMLLYGPPGAGKTYLAKTAADAGHRVLLIDAESGSMSVRNSTVDVLPVRSWPDCQAAYKHVAGCLGEYDVVFLDSLTEMQMLLAEDLRLIRDDKTGEVKGKKPRPTLEDWGFIIQRTAAMVRMWRDLPVSVVVVALSMEAGADGEMLIRPSLNGKKLPHQIAGLFDLVGYAQGGEAGEGYSIMFSHAGDRYAVKDRSGNLAAVEAADYAAIHNKVFQRDKREDG